MIGIKKLARALEGLSGIPDWVLALARKLADSDVLTYLVSDACDGVGLDIEVPEIEAEVTRWGIPIRIKPFIISIGGRSVVVPVGPPQHGAWSGLLTRFHNSGSMGIREGDAVYYDKDGNVTKGRRQYQYPPPPKNPPPPPGSKG